MQHFQAAGFSEEVSSLAAAPILEEPQSHVYTFALLTGLQDKELIRLVPKLLK